MKIDEKLLDAYYQGKCSEQERKMVEDWFKEEDYANYHPEIEEHLQAELWSKINSRVQPKSYRLFYWSAAAACIAFICIAFYGLQFRNKGEKDLQFARVETAKGQRARVVLPDGTVVHLNASSSLRYPPHFGNTRRVELTGEAFFDVVKMPSKPFIIRGKTTETCVLGTSFNLVERSNVRNLTVLTGRVSYQEVNTQKMMIVTPNEQVAINNNGSFEKRMVYAKKYIAWKEGKILFDNNTMAEVAATLENWYGVKITIADKRLANESFTGQFEKPQLGEILQTIGFALKFKYTRNEGNIVINPE